MSRWSVAVLIVSVLVAVFVFSTGFARKAKEGRELAEAGYLGNDISTENLDFKKLSKKFGHGSRKTTGNREYRGGRCYWGGQEHIGVSTNYFLEKAKKNLDLTEAQQDSLEELSSRGRDKLVELRTRFKKQRLKVKRLEQKFPSDEGEIFSGIDDLYSTKARLTKLQAKIRLEVKKILGEEKWDRLRKSFGRETPGKPMESGLRSVYEEENSFKYDG